MKTICYLRVSSPKRNGRSRQKTDSQKLALKSYCRLNGIKRATYIQDYATGRNQDRQGIQETLTACRQGRCQQVIIWKLDRLGRSAIETIRTIRELMTLNVKIVITTQPPSADRERQAERGHLLVVANQQDVADQNRVVPGLAFDGREPRDLGELVGNC